jgi:hypothetical protein
MTIYPLFAEAAPIVKPLFSFIVPLLIIALAAVGLVVVVSKIIDVFTTIRFLKEDVADLRKDMERNRRAVDDLRFKS